MGEIELPGMGPKATKWMPPATSPYTYLSISARWREIGMWDLGAIVTMATDHRVRPFHVGGTEAHPNTLDGQVAALSEAVSELQRRLSHFGRID